MTQEKRVTKDNLTEAGRELLKELLEIEECHCPHCHNELFVEHETGEQAIQTTHTELENLIPVLNASFGQIDYAPEDFTTTPVTKDDKGRTIYGYIHYSASNRVHPEVTPDNLEWRVTEYDPEDHEADMVVKERSHLVEQENESQPAVAYKYEGRAEYPGSEWTHTLSDYHSETVQNLTYRNLTKLVAPELPSDTLESYLSESITHP